jgi:hypothetical protein
MGFLGFYDRNIGAIYCEIIKLKISVSPTYKSCDRANLLVVNQVCPGENEADLGDEEEGVVAGGAGDFGGDNQVKQGPKTT